MYGVNGSSDAISRDMNYVLYSSTFKHPADGEFAKIKQLISSDPYPNFDFQNQQQDESYGGNQSSLLRYRSTPSSFFSNLLNDNGHDEFLDHETEARDFMPYAPSSTVMKQERKEQNLQKQDLLATMNGSRGVPSLPPNSSYGYTSQSNLDCASPFIAIDSTTSNLIRQNSTPAGFISSLTAENGFASINKGSSSSTLNNHISFSSGLSSSPSRFLPQITETENSLHESKFSSLKRSRNGVLKMPQNGDTFNHTSNLVHHMSLPKTSSEMAAVDSFLQFQQESTVPLQTRAKRGFATHPRSIAERVRRTRISERIKRLQELFPDIDKHSNTADMLDMAVEFIKNLQKELQTLNDARARCKCSSK